MEQRVCQGIVDDAAAICGALLAELRLRQDLLGAGPVTEKAARAQPDLRVVAAVGGSLASTKPKKEQRAR